MDPTDDGAQGNESVNDSVFAAIAEQNHELYTSQGRKDKAEADPAKTGKEGATSDHTKTQLEKQDKKNVTDEDDPADNAEGLDSQDFSHETPTEVEEESESTDEVAPSQSDPVVEEEDWQTNLPAAPAPFALEAPKPDEYGQIDPQDFQTYVIEKAKADMRVEGYNQFVENRALDAAEKILPELKTNPAIRTMVENARVASILNGSQINAYDAAKLVKEALGISPAKLAEAESKGAQNAKVSITVQKQASVEKQGATKKKVENTKKTNLDRRLKAGDSSAFEELMTDWLDTGKV